MQAVVDSQGRFMDVVTGLPGSVNDKRIFAESDLRDILRTREMLFEPVVKLDGPQFQQSVLCLSCLWPFCLQVH